MTNFDLLQSIIYESGMKIEAICKKAGISRATFYNRLKNRGEFTASEIQGITVALSLSKEQRDGIFFAD